MITSVKCFLSWLFFSLLILGIVHLDLKPQNFVLVYGQLKLIDLGISRLLPDDSTTVNHWLKLGTLSFMSPEQLEEAAAIPSSSSSLNQSFFLGPEVDQENRFKVVFCCFQIMHLFHGDISILRVYFSDIDCIRILFFTILIL